MKFSMKYLILLLLISSTCIYAMDVQPQTKPQRPLPQLPLQRLQFEGVGSLELSKNLFKVVNLSFRDAIRQNLAMAETTIIAAISGKGPDGKPYTRFYMPQYVFSWAYDLSKKVDPETNWGIERVRYYETPDLSTFDSPGYKGIITKPIAELQLNPSTQNLELIRPPYDVSGIDIEDYILFFGLRRHNLATLKKYMQDVENFPPFLQERLIRRYFLVGEAIRGFPSVREILKNEPFARALRNTEEGARHIEELKQYMDESGKSEPNFDKLYAIWKQARQNLSSKPSAEAVKKTAAQLAAAEAAQIAPSKPSVEAVKKTAAQLAASAAQIASRKI